ncbi:uncharacterized protein J7T54_007088 [Emericellopsis cladophorae]|uniref:F-box domain-containing protein n=1 Tax=Emericellopsis cladophorae TaxID=2686198 RepID=A0A9P9Y8K9_9HYPO|nr:uncharacterized protein J7T54_007088 [Emericellopsis cladophorae]KAI6785446.1 hypothetical protein J7T54_007088 [Emericellopsis cladophorae]
MAPSAGHITDLPAEVLHNVFAWLDPASVLTSARVSHLFRDLIVGNGTLWRDVYLLKMDTPAPVAGIEWEQETLDLVRLDTIFHSMITQDVDLSQLEFVAKTCIRILSRASHINSLENLYSGSSSANVAYLQSLFGDGITGMAFLQQSGLFEHIRSGKTWYRRGVNTPGEIRRKRQLSAKLHTLYGQPILNYGRTRSCKTHPYAVSRVYDIRGFTEDNRWGPWNSDGTVDWEKVEAINIVLGKNVKGRWPGGKIFDEVWDCPFGGAYRGAFVPKNEPDDDELDDLDKRDPYGVSGSWYRIVCFLDYSDFFHFNFTTRNVLDSVAMPPLHAGEATRLIIMEIKVVRIEPPGPDDHPSWPVVHYEGESRSLDDIFDDNANSDLRGTVRMTKGLDVRWTSVSVFDGQERWASEGVQVAGPKSARGVLGTWFDRDHDPHGPAGPTAFWKARDQEDPRRALREGVRIVRGDPSWVGHLLGDDEDEGEEVGVEGMMVFEDDIEEDLGSMEEGEMDGLLEDQEREVTDLAGRPGNGPPSS